MARILNISGAEIKDRGIRKLAEYVEANLPDEFTLIIGCKPSIYDVDAVLIGRGNIYAIECKDWKGNIKGGTYGWWQKDGQVIENPLQQARTNAVALGKWLRKISLDKTNAWAKGLLVFTHENAELSLNIEKESLKGVSTLLLSELAGWIEKRKSSDSKATDSIIDFFYKSVNNSGICSHYINNNYNNSVPRPSVSIYTELLISIFLSIIIFLIFGKQSLFYIGLFAGFYFFIIKPLQKKYGINPKHKLTDPTFNGVSGLSDDFLVSRRHSEDP